MKLKTIFSVALGFQHLSLSSEMRTGMFKPSVQHMYLVDNQQTIGRNQTGWGRIWNIRATSEYPFEARHVWNTKSGMDIIWTLIEGSTPWLSGLYQSASVSVFEPIDGSTRS